MELVIGSWWYDIVSTHRFCSKIPWRLCPVHLRFAKLESLRSEVLAAKEACRSLANIMRLKGLNSPNPPNRHLIDQVAGCLLRRDTVGKPPPPAIHGQELLLNTVVLLYKVAISLFAHVYKQWRSIVMISIDQILNPCEGCYGWGSFWIILVLVGANYQTMNIHAPLQHVFLSNF